MNSRYLINLYYSSLSPRIVAIFGLSNIQNIEKYESMLFNKEKENTL